MTFMSALIFFLFNLPARDPGTALKCRHYFASFPYAGMERMQGAGKRARASRV